MRRPLTSVTNAASYTPLIVSRTSGWVVRCWLLLFLSPSNWLIAHRSTKWGLQMAMTNGTGLTVQQQRWFSAVCNGLQRDTGKTLAEWIAIARECPETSTRGRLMWLKRTHGLLQNRATYVLGEAFPGVDGWNAPLVLRERLWSDPLAQAILEALEIELLALPYVIAGQRKTFSVWSRNYQFAAARPVRGGTVRLALALALELHSLLQLVKREAWSERLNVFIVLESPYD